MLQAGVVEAAAGPAEPPEQPLHECPRGGEPALVEGAAVESQKTFGHARIVIEEAFTGGAAVCPGVEEKRSAV